MMHRRTWLAGSGGLFAVLLVGEARPAAPAGKVPRIGLLGAGLRSADPWQALVDGLRELGYLEGQTVEIVHRYADGRADRLPQLAAELANDRVDIIVVGGENSARAVSRVTRTIPIVIAAGADPVQSGLVASLARPGGNVTGLSSLRSELAAKRLELLKEALPGLTRVGVLRDPSSLNAAQRWASTEVAARTLMIQLRSLEVRSPDDLPAAFRIATRERVQAIIVFSDFVVDSRVIRLAADARLPTMFERPDRVEAGGLMSYGPSRADLFRRAATYVDKILKGAKPGDLPIEQPTKFELSVNLKTAKALGLTVPTSVLTRADQVIE